MKNCHTWSWVNKFERKVCLQLSAHATEDEFDLDTVADHDTQEVILVTRVRQAGGREVGLISDLAQSCIKTEATDPVAILGQGFEDNTSVEVGPRL